MQQHQQFSPASNGSIATNFGDGFLLAHNQIFAAIRKKIIQQDIQISSDMNSDYAVFPLSQLDVLLVQRKMYFYDNVSILKKIESKTPRTIDWDEISAQLRRNYLFHESCHFVSRAVTQKYPIKNADLTTPIVVTMLEESFSNACELLAVKDVEDAVHAVFFEFSSYIVHFETKSLIKKLISEIGFEKLFQWTMLSYLHSNFLVESINEQQTNSMLKFLGITASGAVIKKLKSLAKIAFQLNPEFLNATTGFYLKYNLISKSPNEIRKIDFMAHLESTKQYRQMYSELSQFN